MPPTNLSPCIGTLWSLVHLSKLNISHPMATVVFLVSREVSCIYHTYSFLWKIHIHTEQTIVHIYLDSKNSERLPILWTGIFCSLGCQITSISEKRQDYLSSISTENNSLSPFIKNLSGIIFFSIILQFHKWSLHKHYTSQCTAKIKIRRVKSAFQQKATVWKVKYFPIKAYIGKTGALFWPRDKFSPWGKLLSYMLNCSPLP